MLFYPSKTNDRLNGRVFAPEQINGRIMVNPKHPVKYVLPGTLAVCDSGAFQDIDDAIRLTPAQALDRQLRLEQQILFNSNGLKIAPDKRIGWDWHFEAVVIYDQMAGVDEAIDENGRKVKKRGTTDTAAAAVAETLRSAAYYHSQRHRIQGALCFAGQGVTPDQYVNDCLIPMLDFMQPGDWFAFGGFCIIGKARKVMLPIFYETYDRVMPLLRKAGILRAHLLGVCIPEAVTYAAQIARREGLEISTDSSAPEQAGSIYGKTYEEGRQKQTYTKAQKFNGYHPHELAMKNIGDYCTWAERL